MKTKGFTLIELFIVLAIIAIIIAIAFNVLYPPEPKLLYTNIAKQEVWEVVPNKLSEFQANHLNYKFITIAPKETFKGSVTNYIVVIEKIEVPTEKENTNE